MRYIFVKQQDATDCAAACLAMVCLKYKKEVTITKLRDMMGTDLKGTNLIGLQKCAEKLGFEAAAVKVEKESFLSNYSKPAIANIITEDGLSHFVVVFKVTEKYVVVGDPAKDLMRINLDNFLDEFTGIMLILQPGNDFVSSKKGRGENTSFQRFLQLLARQKKLFCFSVIASFMITILGITSALLSKIIMDEVIPYKLDNLLLTILIVFGIIALTKIVIELIRDFIMLYLSQKIDIPLMLGYFKHIYSLPMRFFSTRKTGDIITRFTDAFTIKDIFTNVALTLVMDIVMAIITGIVLLSMNEVLFFIISLLTLVSIILVFIFKQPYKMLNIEQMQQNATLNSEIIEGLQGVETIKSNAIEEVELENIEKEYIKGLRLAFKEGTLSNIQDMVSDFVQTFGSLMLMFFGVKQVIYGDITLGNMMAFMTLSEYFMDPIGRLVGLQLEIQEANISMKRVSEILEYESEQQEEYYQDLETVKGNIEIKNLTFRYGNRAPALNDVSLCIPEGKKTAIVGSSGSGKSTLAKLLLKYYEAETGEILVDGLNIKKISNLSLRKKISYVPQRIELFSKSIFDNIRVSKMDASLDDVIEAARLADAHDFICKLPLQYHTFLEEGGEGLSGGERQRLALARAFLKKNDFYILDEPTSNLDFTTENIIFDMIYNQLHDKTVLIIAHRLATIQYCDQIIVLDHGEIVEQGTHEELLKNQSKYYQLWKMQQGIQFNVGK